MDRQELIQTLIPGLVKNTGSVEKEVRQVLETYNQTGLEKEFQRQTKLGYQQTQIPTPNAANDEDLIKQIHQIRAEATREWENSPERIREQQQDSVEMRDYALTQIFKCWVPGHGFAKRNSASEALIISWLNYDEGLTVPWYLDVLADNPSLASQLQWTQKNKQESEAHDKQTFAAVAKALRSFGITEANFNPTRSVLGPDFTFTELQDRIADGSLELSPASQTERDQWAASDIESHNARLLQASPAELRTLARQESEHKRAEEETQQARASLAAQQQREAPVGFPKIPSDITRQRVIAATPSEIKYWSKRYGQYQLNRILAGQQEN